jgi:hypothetical protein
MRVVKQYEKHVQNLKGLVADKKTFTFLVGDVPYALVRITEHESMVNVPENHILVFRFQDQALMALHEGSVVNPLECEVLCK